jgi:hypothetical protein
MSFSIADFEQFRSSSDVDRFTNEFLQEEREENVAGDRHMDLAVWCKFHPHEALAIILTLLDKTEEYDAIQERIAMNDVERIVEWPPDDFIPYLVHAVRTHPRFALCTKWKREHADTSRWKAIQEKVNAYGIT